MRSVRHKTSRAPISSHCGGTSGKAWACFNKRLLTKISVEEIVRDLQPARELAFDRLLHAPSILSSFKVFPASIKLFSEFKLLKLY